MRASAEPGDQLEAVVGRKGLLRWGGPAAPRAARCARWQHLCWLMLMLPGGSASPLPLPLSCRRFWDCCGDEEESSPGCQSSYHVTYDAEINEANGWSS